MTAQVIALAAEKGGVGKTTLTSSVADILASFDKRVLVIDTDKQGNVSEFYLGEGFVDRLHTLNTIAAVLDPEFDPDPETVIHPTKKNKNVFIAPVHRPVMAQLTLPEPYWTEELEFSIRDFVDEVSDSFDYVIIDTRPDLDTLPTWAALLAARYLLSPIEPGRYSAQSAAALEARFWEASKRNNRLTLLGYVINQIDYRTSEHKGVEESFRKHYGERVFESVVKRLTDIQRATNRGVSVQQFAPKSQAAYHVKEFVIELMRRIRFVDEQAGEMKIWPKEIQTLSALGSIESRQKDSMSTQKDQGQFSLPELRALSNG